jgi:hypothetical protein
MSAHATKIDQPVNGEPKNKWSCGPARFHSIDSLSFTLYRQRWDDRVQHGDATFALCIQTFMTGLLNILLYTTSQVWVGFQTGNMVQFSGNM